MIYFDYAATTPLDEVAAQTYVEAATKYFGNTGSLHDLGGTAKDLLENCRSVFADLLGVSKAGIYFTSGGSESNFLGIHALLSSRKNGGRHIISSMAEHSSIQSTLNSLAHQDYDLTLLPFHTDGIIDVEALKKATRGDTVLISIQHANSEIGTIQPIEEIAAWCRKQNILFHCDCVHTFGKLDLQPIANVVDSLSISSHKFFGPKGVGAVYVNPKHAWKPYYPGTTHENGFRPGTVNVPAIAAMTEAAQKSMKEHRSHYEQAQKLRQLLLSVLEAEKDQITVYGSHDNKQLPYTIGLRLHSFEGQWVMLECNRRGFAISTGSACSIGLQSASVTMMAMKIPEKIGKEFIRISFGHPTTEKDMIHLGQALLEIIRNKK